MNARLLVAWVIVLLFSNISHALAFETLAKQALLLDDSTGSILYEKDAHVPMYPSSMTKLMTAYVVFEQLRDGKLALTDTLPVSEKAWRMQGSKMFVELGKRISVLELIQGVIIQSGNDACIVLAEGVAGSEEHFAEMMNHAAKRIGMTESHFVNSTGWPDDKHITTARDLALLAQRIVHDFPDFYRYFSEKEFTYHGIKQGNRNLLLYKDIGVDGLKTGHTEAAGYGIVVSGKDASGRRVHVVVNGLQNEKERAQEVEKLFLYGLRSFEQVPLIKKGQVIEAAPVWFGVEKQVNLVAAQDAVVTLPKGARNDVSLRVKYTSPLKAPLNAGQPYGQLQVEREGKVVMSIPLVAEKPVEKLSGLKRVWRILLYKVTGT